MTGAPHVAAYLAPREMEEIPAGSTAIVVDVLRATSCIVEAMANGAEAVYPAVSISDALALRDELGEPEALLCGERGGVLIEGFDLGNSPAEFSEDRVRGRRLVMTTTNGTKALAAVAGADRILVASYLNLGAVADAVSKTASIVIVCAGKEDNFGLDDTVCAGLIVRRLVSGADSAEGRKSKGAHLNDGAVAAAILSMHYALSPEMLAKTEAGKALIEVGLESDLELCAKSDSRRVVPVMQGPAITLPSR